jgi:hypothetical protein
MLGLMARSLTGGNHEESLTDAYLKVTTYGAALGVKVTISSVLLDLYQPVRAKDCESRDLRRI